MMPIACVLALGLALLAGSPQPAPAPADEATLRARRLGYRDVAVRHGDGCAGWSSPVRG